MLPDLHVVDSWARAALETLLNGFWQGGVLTASAWVLLRVLPRSSAATRHVICWFAMLMVVLLPLLSALPGDVGSQHAVVASDGLQREPAGPVGQTASDWSVLRAPPEPWPLTILALLAVVAAFRVLGIVRGLIGLGALKRRSLPVSAEACDGMHRIVERYGTRGVRIHQSTEIASPVTVGFLHPLVLLPGHLFGALTREQLNQVVAHELAHVRRLDDWTNLVQRLLEAMLFFYPFVRWLGTRLELEREIACDDEAVAGVSDRRSYALCLTRVAQVGVSGHMPLAPGAAAKDTQLARRIQSLLAPVPPASRRIAWSGVALALPVLMGGTVALHSAPSVSLVPGTELALAMLPGMQAGPAQLGLQRADAGEQPVRGGYSPAPHEVGPASRGIRTGAAGNAEWREPRIALSCGSAPCDALQTLPAIVDRVEAVMVPQPRPSVASRGPAPPRGGDRSSPAVEISLSLRVPVDVPISLARPVIGAASESWNSRRRPAFGGSRAGWRLHLSGGGGLWQRPPLPLPRWGTQDVGGVDPRW